MDGFCIRQHIFCVKTTCHIDGLEQKRRNSIANALELHFSCINPLIYKLNLRSCWFTWCWVQSHCSKTWSHFYKILTTDTPYFNQEGEVWGVFCEWKSEIYMSLLGCKQHHVMLDPLIMRLYCNHDDIMPWNSFLHCWPFVCGFHQWRMDSPHKGQEMPSFDVGYYVSLNTPLNKQSSYQWFQILWCSFDITV